MSKHSRSTIMLAAAVAAGLAGYSVVQAAPTIDGTLDGGAVYTRFGTQTNNTGFGNNQSELDAAYYRIENGKLYVFLAGNLESNFNKMEVFFDTRTGGQNVMRSDNPGIDFNQVNNMSGTTFDTNFSPDYLFFYTRNTTDVFLNFTELNTNGGGFGAFLGQIQTPNANQQGSGTVGGTNGNPLVELGNSDANTAGVSGDTSVPANPTDAEAVTTGGEFSIDLWQIGATENFRIMIGINGSSHDFWSNQFIAGLPAPMGNLGDPHTTNFANLAGDQSVQINYHAPLSNWSAVGNGNWNLAGNWTGDGVPNAPDARAVLGTAGGTGAHTITLDTNVRLQSLTFDSPGSYTIAPSGANTLTIAGNSALPAVLVNQGNHTIAAPLVLGNTTNFTVATGASLNVTGDLTANTFTIVKDGPGLLQFKQLNVPDIFVSQGTVAVASNGTAANVSRINSLRINGGSLTPSATLDMKDNDAVVSSVNGGSLELNYAALTSMIKFARNNGNWDQPGVTSSAARAASPRITTLGVMTGTEYASVHNGNFVFDGVTLANTDLAVKYTYYGDSDFNGKIDGADYARIDATFNNEANQGNIGGWVNGDLDYNGKVDGADYALIDAAFNAQGNTVLRMFSFLDGSNPDRSTMRGPALGLVLKHYDEFGEGYVLAGLSAVPEPSSMLLATGLVVGGIARRRRRA